MNRKFELCMLTAKQPPPRPHSERAFPGIVSEVTEDTGK